MGLFIVEIEGVREDIQILYKEDIVVSCVLEDKKENSLKVYQQENGLIDGCVFI